MLVDWRCGFRVDVLGAWGLMSYDMVLAYIVLLCVPCALALYPRMVSWGMGRALISS